MIINISNLKTDSGVIINGKTYDVKSSLTANDDQVIVDGEIQNVGNQNWIKVFNGVGYPMPEEDCEIWIARGNCFGDGWIQKVDYYVGNGYIEWDGTYAYQKYKEGKTPEPFTMRFAGNKEIICEIKK